MIEDFKEKLEKFKTDNNIVANSRLSKQQEILKKYKEELIELKKEKMTFKNIILFLEEVLEVEKGVIKESSLKTFFKNNEITEEEKTENKE